VASKSVVYEGWSEGAWPDRQILVSEWADLYRRLPQKSSAEPGPWRTSRTPYLREPMDCMSARSPVEEVVFMKGAQVGGTEAILNALGYLIDHSPGPAMIVQPTVETAKRFSRQRLTPLLEETPQLAGKVADSHTRDASNSMLTKEFMGGVLIITGANSAVGLRSMPARWLLLDEIDGYPADVDEEGAPIDLAEARQRTFARRKRMKISTPTIAGSSAIERAYMSTDRRRYHVPCPRCGEMQPLEFARLQWSKLGRPPARAVYCCRGCDGIIEDHEKTAMLAAGEWVPEDPDANPKVRGYHLSALYSPVGWMSWGQIAESFVRVHRNPEKFRVFTNTVLGETWAERGEAPEWERIRDRREPYVMRTVPAGGLLLTAGADVQKDRIVFEVVAWGRGKESWSIDYAVLPGDTANLELVDGPWKKLDALMGRTFTHQDGAEMPVRMLAVDSGYNTQQVYTWCRRYPLNRVIAVKGVVGGAVLISSPSAVDIKLTGKRPVRGYKVWPVCGSVAKSELYGWLRLDRPAEGEAYAPGWCHFPEYDDEFFRQLTAEHLISVKNKKGFIRYEWALVPGRENHALDARVYARAAAQIVGLDRFGEKEWADLEQMVAQAPDRSGDGGAPAAKPAPARPSGFFGNRRPGGFWGNRG
jgi:phage terminase large subunit GpA-like protein